LLVVGLGNPGSKYQQTPHNLGFEVIDELAKRWGISSSKKFKSDFFQHTLADAKVWLMKPQTFMNLSGEAVQPAAHFYGIAPQSILVISDDIDLPPGRIRVRINGGSGGHNGLKSIAEHLGTTDFPRIRIGVGRGLGMPPDAWVLSSPSAMIRRSFRLAVELAADAVEMTLIEGLAKAMNTYNLKKEEPREP